MDFGVSGALWNSSQVMYDRQTRSVWAQFTGQGILGVLAGVQLHWFPVTLASWAEFKAAHPAGVVLSRDTGFANDYGRTPTPATTTSTPRRSASRGRSTGATPP